MSSLNVFSSKLLRLARPDEGEGEGELVDFVLLLF